MTKLLGRFVGVPVQAYMASGAGPISNLYKDHGDRVLMRDYATSSGNVIGDAISLGSFNSTAWLNPFRSTVFADAFGAGVTLSFGDVNYPSGIRGAVSVATGQSGMRLFQQGQLGAIVSQPLWQHLGYAADPGGVIELLASFGGANPANAGLGWEIIGRNL